MACLYSVMLPWQQNTRQLKYQNTEVYLFILCYANFGDPGINGFGKIENATQVSKTVFSHLKTVGHDTVVSVVILLWLSTANTDSNAADVKLTIRSTLGGFHLTSSNSKN